MPRRLGVGQRLGEHGLVGVLDRLAQRPPAGDRRAQRLERGGARDLAGAVPAHAVGDRDQPHRVVDEVGVLVALADAADVGGGPDDEPHVTARPRRRSGRTAPGRRVAAATACTSGSPFSSVPLREPRSSTYTAPSRRNSARVHGRHERVVGEHDPAAAAAADGELVGRARSSRPARLGGSRIWRWPGPRPCAGLAGREAGDGAPRGGAAGCCGTGAGARISSPRPAPPGTGTGRGARGSRTSGW